MNNTVQALKNKTIKLLQAYLDTFNPALIEIKGTWIMVNISFIFTGVSMYWK